MKIGILQCGHLEEEIKKNHGAFSDMFSTLLVDNGFTFETYAVVDNIFPSSIDECDGWFVTGSAHGAYDKLEWIPLLENFIRESFENDIPLVGICFGHQIIAQALGGRVEKYAGGWSIGPARYFLTRENDYIDLFSLHQDQVVEIPTQSQVVMSSEFCANAGLAYKGKALSFQPHPEFTPRFMRDMIKYKMSRGFSREIGETALEKVNEQTCDSGKIIAQITNFYKDANRRKNAVTSGLNHLARTSA